MDYETNHPLIEQARGLLSAYIDGEATDDETRLVEQALQRWPQLQIEVESLQQTVKLVQALPRVPAPRPFTLSEADVGRQPARPSTWLAWFKPFAGAAAALTAVVVVGFMVLNGMTRTGGDMSTVALAPAAPAEVMMEAAPAEPAATQAAEMEMPAAADMAAEPAAEVQSMELPAEAVEKEAEAEMTQPMALEAAPAPPAAGEGMMRSMTQPETGTVGMGGGAPAPAPMAAKAITATDSASLTEQIALPMVSGGDTAVNSAEEAAAPQSPLPTAPALSEPQASEPPPAAQPVPSTEMPLWGQLGVIVLGILVGAAVYVFLRRRSEG